MSAEKCEACRYVADWKEQLQRFLVTRMNAVWSTQEHGTHEYICWKIGLHRKRDCRCVKNPKELP